MLSCVFQGSKPCEVTNFKNDDDMKKNSKNKFKEILFTISVITVFLSLVAFLSFLLLPSLEF